jgi:hypothetical protein
MAQAGKIGIYPVAKEDTVKLKPLKEEMFFATRKAHQINSVRNSNMSMLSKTE